MQSAAISSNNTPPKKYRNRNEIIATILETIRDHQDVGITYKRLKYELEKQGL